MIGRPDIGETIVGEAPAEQDPARSATQRLAHGGKCAVPARHAAKVALYRLRQTGRGCNGRTETGEIDFVQRLGVPGDQFFTLDAVEPVTGQRGGIGSVQLGANGDQSPYGPGIIGALVLTEQIGRQTGQAAVEMRESQWLDCARRRDGEGS